jgi:hypothetical protein
MIAASSIDLRAREVAMDVVANSFFAKPDGDAIVAFENRADIGELPLTDSAWSDMAAPAAS